MQQQSISSDNVSRARRILNKSMFYLILAITLSKAERVFDRCRTAGTCITRYVDGRAPQSEPEH
jgi:hypothetical protein